MPIEELTVRKIADLYREKNGGTIVSQDDKHVILSKRSGITTIIKFLVSRTSNDDGFFIKETHSQKVEARHKSTKNKVHDIILGKRQLYWKEVQIFKCFVPDNGVITLTEKGKKKYFSPNTSELFAERLSIKLLRELVKAKMPSQEWYIDKTIDPRGHRLPKLVNLNFLIATTPIRGCSNLKQFLDKLNQTKHSVSPKWFKSHSLHDIVSFMMIGKYFKNAPELWRSCNNLPGGMAQLILDTIKLIDEPDKFFEEGKLLYFSMNIKGMERQHDELLEKHLEYLEEHGDSRDLNVADVYLHFNKYFPKLKLLGTDASVRSEGLRQRHCIDTRISYVDSGESGIYTMLYEGRRITVELRCKNTGLYIYEMKGFANDKLQEEKEITRKAKDYVQTVLTLFNEDKDKDYFDQYQHNLHIPF